MTIRSDHAIRTVLAILLVGIGLSFAPMCSAAEHVMVIYNREAVGSPGRDLSLYDIDATRFAGEALDGFVEALAEAQVLYLAQVPGAMPRCGWTTALSSTWTPMPIVRRAITTTT